MRVPASRNSCIPAVCVFRLQGTVVYLLYACSGFKEEFMRSEMCVATGGRVCELSLSSSRNGWCIKLPCKSSSDYHL